MARRAASVGAGSSAASITASSRVVLSSKTRKMVPSAMPAAWAISRVVSAGPLLQEEREGGGDDRRPPLLERQGRRPYPSWTWVTGPEYS